MVSLSPCGIVLTVVIILVVITWVAARAWTRGFVLAWEGCKVGAFDDSTNTYMSSEGLAYASKNPPLSTAVKQARSARALASSRGGEGFVYHNEHPQQKDSKAYQKQTEGFTSFDMIIPDMPVSPALGAATPTSPYVGHL
jgi:hypothetical protein